MLTKQTMGVTVIIRVIIPGSKVTVQEKVGRLKLLTVLLKCKTLCACLQYRILSAININIKRALYIKINARDELARVK